MACDKPGLKVHFTAAFLTSLSIHSARVGSVAAVAFQALELRLTDKWTHVNLSIVQLGRWFSKRRRLMIMRGDDLPLLECTIFLHNFLKALK